jgi:DNA-binding MarR family transcriptional regulator
VVSPTPAVSDTELVSWWDAVNGGFDELRSSVERELAEACGMPSNWAHALLRLRAGAGHPVPMNVLAKQVGMTNGGFTKLVDRLQDAGLVARADSPDDRRVVPLLLTEVGAERADRAVAAYLSILRRQLAPLSVGERDELRATVGVMREAAALSH